MHVSSAVLEASNEWQIPLDLELQAVASCWTGMLGTELESLEEQYVSH